MSIIKHITLQKIVAHDFQYDPRSSTIFRKLSTVKYKEDVSNGLGFAIYMYRTQGRIERF